MIFQSNYWNPNQSITSKNAGLVQSWQYLAETICSFGAKQQSLTVNVVPHIIDEIKNKYVNKNKSWKINVIAIGYQVNTCMYNKQKKCFNSWGVNIK